jgi:hypothetical protein
MNTSDSMICEAFNYAVSYLDRASLTPDLQTKISAIRHQMQEMERSPLPQSGEELVSKILVLIEQYPALATVYDSAHQKLQDEYRSRNRAKGISLGFDNSFFTHSNDASNPATRNPDFWEKGDRVLVMAAGGAILGSMLAKVPGAVVGAILAGIYGWYTHRSKHSVRTRSAK